MSAIFGKITYQQRKDLTKDCEKMLQGYEKCVFDRTHTELFEKGFMGCVSLFVQETDQNDLLPINKTPCCISFDGMIDNRSELCMNLHLSEDTPNGQLVFHAYQKWNTDMLLHLEGIYSIAIYDFSNDTLFIANDRTASRCLYYYVSEEECIFSTLLRPIVNVQTNPSVLSEQYLTDYAFLPGLMPTLTPHETPYEHIYKLEPATFLLIQKGKIFAKKQYWKPIPNAKSYKKSECGKAFLSLFESCVAKVIHTPFPVSIAMSSGLDSSSIGAVAATQLREQNRPLHTFTYIPVTDDIPKFSSYDIVNEKDDVLKIAAIHPNMIPHFITNDGKDCYQELDTLLDELEIPIKAFVNAPILRYLYQQSHKEGCRIVLNGQYGNSTISFGNPDDIMYHLYKQKDYVNLLTNQWNYCSKTKVPFFKDTIQLIKYFKQLNHSKTDQKSSKQYLEPFFFSKELFEETEKEKRFLQNGMITNQYFIPAKKDYPDISYSQSALTYIGEFETKLGLYTGVMVRDVSRDPSIIQFCNDIPFGAFMQHGIPRWLIRGNFSSYLPKELLHNMIRYGLQNGDWLVRLSPSWNKYHTEMTILLQDSAYSRYLNIESLSNFLKENQIIKTDDISLDSKFTFFSFVYIFLKYLQKNKDSSL